MCYEVSCKKFLRDCLGRRRRGGIIKIRTLNQIIDKVREIPDEMVVIEFSQPALSSLINVSKGNLKWENGCIRFNKDFLDDLGKEQFEPLPDDLEQKYLKIVTA